MNKAFTLIELIFVIVILGLLASVALPKFDTSKKNAEIANLPEVAKQVINKAEEQYHLVQEANLSKIIQEDAELVDYNNSIAKYNFVTDMNSTAYEINYTTQDGGNYLCLRIKRIEQQVRFSRDTNVTTYKFILDEYNRSCNPDTAGGSSTASSSTTGVTAITGLFGL